MPWRHVIPVLLNVPPGDLCQSPYPGHRHGCPNYGKRDSCPPRAPLFTSEMLDWPGSEIWAIWSVFPFGQHARRMQREHPNWSQRQCKCCLYWQGGARRQLRSEVTKFLAEVQLPVPLVCWTPEARGMNVTATMRQIGIVLEWPPHEVAYQVALAVRVWKDEV